MCYWFSCNPTVINCTFTGSSAWSPGGAIYTDGFGSATVANCILWGNTGPQIYGAASATYSCVQGGCGGEGNINADPLFVDADGDVDMCDFALFQAGFTGPQ